MTATRRGHPSLVVPAAGSRDLTHCRIVNRVRAVVHYNNRWCGRHRRRRTDLIMGAHATGTLMRHAQRSTLPITT